MSKKRTYLDPKKIPYHLALVLLTSGASLILGFLSFGGMYAFLPLLPLAFAGFVLSVAYEGEIYLQNIKGALKKLFKSNYLQKTISDEYLLAHFPEDVTAKDCPQFFRDYQAQLQLLSAFERTTLDKASRKRKLKIEQTLRDMERWFSQQLFSPSNADNDSDYVMQLKEWLKNNQKEEWHKRLASRKLAFNIAKGFSILSGLFMGLGSTYLIVEAFSVIPYFASISFALWPIMIVPMALIAGTAYGLLTFNSITDMINNNTLKTWYYKLRDDFKKGVNIRNIFMATTAVLLVALAVVLTICTAGTWWTVAKNARPLFEWMGKMPSMIMGIINPIITGFSAIFFNVQNSAESLDLVDQATKEEHIFKRFYHYIVTGFKNLRQNENWLQIVNPFRIILKLVITPLRMVLFLGHLISIGVTTDRMPGVSQIVAALIAMISEGFEDAHYFVGHNHDHDESGCHEHEHDHYNDHPKGTDTKILLKKRLSSHSGHSHDLDIPTRLIQFLAAPLYALAALWDFSSSKLNKPTEEPHKRPHPLSFKDAWKKQHGMPIKTEHVDIAADAQQPSKEWRIEHGISLIEKHHKKHLAQARIGSSIAQEKITQLNALKTEVKGASSYESLKMALEDARNEPVYGKHRLFSSKVKTCTQDFIEALPERICGTGS